MVVTHCVCSRMSLAQILDWARDHNANTLNDVVAGLGVSKECGICVPYIEYAMATGQTAIPYPCPDIKSLPPGSCGNDDCCCGGH